MRSRKSQVTLYIIIGILLVIFITLLIFLVREKKLPSQPPEIITLSDNLNTVNNFVRECVRHTTIQGLNLLGKNGGYINPSNLNAEFSPVAYESDVLIYQPDFIPYWHYIDKSNSFNSFRPRLYKQSEGDNSIQEQLNNYVEHNLKACTAGFEAFPDFDISEGDIKVDSEIRSQEIVVNVIYPLRVVSKSNQSATELKSFSKSVDVNVMQIYEFATEITNAEKKYTFFETVTMNLISVYAAIDSESLPPTSSLLLGRDKTIWVRSEIEQTIKYDVLDFIRLIQLQNALNYNPLIISPAEPDYELKQGLYNSFNFQLDSHKQYNLTVEFMYPQSPIFLSIDDSEIIMPDDRIPSNFFTDMIGLQIQDYTFEYDLAYPIIVKIKDPKAFNYQSYEFQFALEANIRDNTPINSSMVLTAPVRPPRKIDINEPGQLVLEPLIVTAKDKVTGQLLSDVDIYYKCGQKVYIGRTESDGTIFTSFPYCLLGGKIIYLKQGYLGSAISYNNNEQSTPKELTVELWPKQGIDFEIKKRTQQNIDSLDVSKTGPLPPAERRQLELEQATIIPAHQKIIMTITRVKEDDNEDTVPVPSFIILHPNAKSADEIESMRQVIEDLSLGILMSRTQLSLCQEIISLKAISWITAA